MKLHELYIYIYIYIYNIVYIYIILYIIFNSGVADVSEVFASVQVKVWSWILAKSRFSYFPYSSWVLNHLDCMRLIM